MTEYSILSDYVDCIYEHPFGERIKLLLKLEDIFSRVEYHKLARNKYETQMCLDAIFALLNVTNRYELRSIMLKELDRINDILLNINSVKNIDIDTDSLRETLKQLAHCKDVLHELDSKNIDILRNIEFLNTIKLRNIHDTGSFLFEIPELRYWLLQGAEERSKQINNWFNDFIPFKEATEFLLRNIRERSKSEGVIAKSGIYIKTVNSKNSMNQLLRISIDKNYNVYPSISGNGYRFAIRFMEQKQVDIRAKQTNKDVEFYLGSCDI